LPLCCLILSSVLICKSFRRVVSGAFPANGQSTGNLSRHEYLLDYSCKSRYFCPSCHRNACCCSASGSGRTCSRRARAAAALLRPATVRPGPLDALSEADRTDFLAAWSQGHRMQRDGANARLTLNNGWWLPLPIVRSGEGWVFDVRAGKEELRVRRIDRNELAAIKAVHAFVDAQREYAEQDRNADGVLENARRFLSSPGKQDGRNKERPNPGVKRRRDQFMHPDVESL